MSPSSFISKRKRKNSPFDVLFESKAKQEIGLQISKQQQQNILVEHTGHICDFVMKIKKRRG